MVMFLSEKEMRDSFISKLKVLLKRKYDSCLDDTTRRNFKSRSAFYRYLSEKYPNDFVASTIRSWGKVRNAGENSGVFVPDVFKIGILCRELDCDLEYFYTDQSLPRRAAASVSECLGVSVNAADLLINAPEKEILEYMLTETKRAPFGWLRAILTRMDSLCFDPFFRVSIKAKGIAGKTLRRQYEQNKFFFYKSLDDCIAEVRALKSINAISSSADDDGSDENPFLD